jgi:hypothetical protein
MFKFYRYVEDKEIEARFRYLHALERFKLRMCASPFLVAETLVFLAVRDEYESPNLKKEIVVNSWCQRDRELINFHGAWPYYDL